MALFFFLKKVVFSTVLFFRTLLLGFCAVEVGLGLSWLPAVLWVKSPWGSSSLVSGRSLRSWPGSSPSSGSLCLAQAAEQPWVGV